MERNLVWCGTHRGAFTIAQKLTPETLNLYAPTLLLADPKANRAEEFRKVLVKQYPTLTPKALSMRAQDVLSVRGDLDTAVLSVDTADDITDTLTACHPSLRVTWQIVGRGPGGVAGSRIALQGTQNPGDHETKRSVSLLLPTLSSMSRPASSRELTGPDPVFATVVRPLREATSRITAKHLEEREREPRDLTGGPLSVIFGQRPCPLIVVQGDMQHKYSQQTALALESAGQLITRGLSGAYVVVAVVIAQAQTVHFMRVALKSTGKRSVAGLTTFAPQRASSTESAVFTD
jgi:hypothetical protein